MDCMLCCVVIFEDLTLVNSVVGVIRYRAVVAE
jgi:hypothetical protein